MPKKFIVRNKVPVAEKPKKAEKKKKRKFIVRKKVEEPKKATKPKSTPKPKAAKAAKGYEPPTNWRKLYDDPMICAHRDLPQIHAHFDYKMFQQKEPEGFGTAKNAKELAKRFSKYVKKRDEAFKKKK